MPERHANSNGRRKSALDLAPLERDCMNALWPLGEATVRDIREALLATRPRAYTTIMTILDRLAHKGVVTRRKVGRAYVYSPAVSAEEARTRAVGQLVENFFGGSPAALLTHLTGETPAPAVAPVAQPRAVAANAGASSARATRAPRADSAAIDETLL